MVIHNLVLPDFSINIMLRKGLCQVLLISVHNKKWRSKNGIILEKILKKKKKNKQILSLKSSPDVKKRSTVEPRYLELAYFELPLISK